MPPWNGRVCDPTAVLFPCVAMLRPFGVVVDVLPESLTVLRVAGGVSSDCVMTKQ